MSVSSIFLIIIGGILLMTVEMFLISSGLFSLVVIVAIGMYNKMDAWKFIVLFLFISIGIDAFFGYFLGTYYLAIVIAVLLHSILKTILPYDRIPIRLLVLFVSFLAFHLSRNLLVEVQFSSLSNISFIELFIRSSIRALVETSILVGVSYLINTYFGKSLTSVKVNL